MPAILTHYTFAKETIPEEDRPFAAVVNLGSQGPDTFMAYGTIPWRKRHEVVKIRQWGHTMHSLPVGSVYLKMVEYAQKSPHKDVLFAYIDGILMHYSVDRIFHAYIFYRSGFDQNGNLKGYWSWSHAFFEAILDQTFAKRKKTYQKMSKCILSPEDQVKEISKMWAYASPAHLDEEAFYRSYKDFVSAENMLYTPLGIKRPLFRLLGKYSTPWAQSHPRFPKKFAVIDVENNGHTLWRDPCTGEEHHESVDEMFASCQESFRKVHQLILSAKAGSDITEEFNLWCDNLDHNGAPIGGKRVYKELCWEVVGKKNLLPPQD